MDSERKRPSSSSRVPMRMAQIVGGAVSALSLSLGMAHAAVDAFQKPGTQPCATGEHCPASNQIKGETPASNQIKGESHDRRAGGNGVDSWSWGAPKGGTSNQLKLDSAHATGTGGGAGKHDRKAGGEQTSGPGNAAVVAPERGH